MIKNVATTSLMFLIISTSILLIPFMLAVGTAGVAEAKPNHCKDNDHANNGQGNNDRYNKNKQCEIGSDFNGDGYADLAIGVASESIGTINQAGAVNVIYGSPSGLSATETRPDQMFHQDTLNVDGIAEPEDHFGRSLAAADFNNDGYTDLAIGAPNEDFGADNTIKNTGAVNVIYGSSRGLSPNVGVDGTGRSDQILYQGKEGIEGVPRLGDVFGFRLTSGDFNGDSFHDLAVSAGGERRINVIYGSPNGLSASYVKDQIFGRMEAISMSSGDFNNDGYDELVIGDPNEVVDGQERAGIVLVAIGTPKGLDTDIDSMLLLTQDYPGMQDESEDNDQFGSSVTTGDFNGDEYDDLAIGAPIEDLGSGSDSIPGDGAVNVIYGSSNGLAAAGEDAVLPSQFWSQDYPKEMIDSIENFDVFGFSLASSDFNNDGFDDLAIGVPQEEINSFVDNGAVNVLYGSSSGLSVKGQQFWTQDSPNVEDDPEGSDEFGYSLVCGDFDGDGNAELAIGVRLEDQPNAIQAGAVNVIYGSSRTGLDSHTKPPQFWHQDSRLVEGGAENFDNFGISLA